MGFVVALGVTLFAGCSTASRSATRERLSETAPSAIAVAPGTAFAAAERIAAAHEGDFVLTGSGDSMLPLYRSGTAVVVHPTSFFMLQPGTPVVYTNRCGEPVAHILLEKCPGGWVAMGINNAGPDDDVVTPRNLVGIVRCAFVGSTEPAGAVARLTPVRTDRLSNDFAALTW